MPNTTFNEMLQMHTYGNNILCVYTIVVSEIALTIIQITHFDLEEDYDFLLVGYGDNPSDFNKVLAKLTGKSKLRTLTSSDHHTWVSFVSDSSGVSSGYDIIIEIKSGNTFHGTVHIFIYIVQPRSNTNNINNVGNFALLIFPIKFLPLAITVLV